MGHDPALSMKSTRFTLRLKVVLLAAGALTALIVLLYVLAQLVLLRHLADQEQTQGNHTIRRVVAMLDEDLTSLSATTAGWAQWDDTYDFMLTGSPAYEKNELDPSLLTSLNLNMLLFVDTEGQLVLSKTFDLTTAQEIPLPTVMQTWLADNPDLVSDIQTSGGQSGLVRQPDGALLLMAGYPILHSDRTGPAAGVLFMGQYVATSRIEIQAVSNLQSIEVVSLRDPELDSRFLAARGRISPEAPFYVAPFRSNQPVTCFALLQDIAGQPDLLLRLTVRHTIYDEGERAIIYYLIAVMLGGTLLVFASLLLGDKWSLRRLDRLNQALNAIGRSGDPAARVPIDNRDELGRVILSINTMLDALQQAHDQLENRIQERTVQLAEERNLLRNLIDMLPDAIYIKDAGSRFVLINKAMCHNLKLDTWKDVVGKTDFDFFPQELATTYHANEQNIVKTGQPLTIDEEPFVMPATGEHRWISTSKIPLKDSDGHVVRIMGIGRDITARKEMEDALRQARDELEQHVQERTAELVKANQTLTAEIKEREQAERALRESEMTKRSILEALPDLVFRISRDGRFLDVHAADESLLALPPDQIIGSLSDGLLPGEVAKQGHPALQRAFETGEMQIVEYTLDVPAGRLNFEARLVVSGPDEVLAIVRNVSERKQAEERIRFQADLLDVVEHAIIAISTDGTVTYWNRFAERLFGWSVDEAIGRHAADLILPSLNRDEAMATIRSTLAGQSWSGEGTLYHRDGHEFPVMLSITPIRDSEGAINGIVGIIADISERKEAEEALRRANRAYYTLSECNQTMVRATTELDLLTRVCQTIVDVGGYRIAWVGYIEDDQTVRPLVHAGREEDGNLEVLYRNWESNKFGQSMNRLAIRTRTLQVTHDINREPRYVLQEGNTPERDYRSAVTLPLLMGEDVLGTLNVYSDQVGAFDQAETNLLEELAWDLAYGITALRTREEHERAEIELRELNTQLERHNRELLTLYEVGRRLTATLDISHVCRVMYEEVGLHLLAASCFSVELFTPDTHSLSCAFAVKNGAFLKTNDFAPLPVGDGLISQALAAGAPLVADLRHLTQDDHQLLQRLEQPGEQPHPQSALLLPLIGSGQTIGVINMQHPEADAFQTTNLTLLATLANQAAIAIQNAQLFADERNQRMLAEMLSDTAAAMNRALDFEEVVDYMLANLGRVLPYDAANIMMFDGTVAHVVRARGYEERGLGEWIMQNEFHMEQYFAMNQVYASRQPLAVTVSPGEPGWPDTPETQWVRSLAIAPIRREDTLVGFLCLDSATPHFFTQRDAQQLQAFADQAAIAIQNAQLFAAEREQRLLAEALTDISAAVNSTLNFEEVLDRILANAGRVAPHDAAHILLIEEGVLRIVRSRVEPEIAAKYHPRLDLEYDIEQTPNLRFMRDTRQALAIPDVYAYEGWLNIPPTRWIRSHAAAPIQQDGQVIGFITLDSAQPGFFNQGHADKLHVFASQVTAAIRNAQLYEAAQDYANELEALASRLMIVNRVSMRLAQTLDRREIFRITLHELQEALGTDFSGLALFENEDQARLVVDTHPDHSDQVDVILPVKNNPSIDYVRRTHKPLVSENVLSDPLFAPSWDVLRPRGTHTLLVVPLLLGDDVIGTIGLDSTRPRTYTEAEITLAATIANQASIAISKAHLYDAEREQRALAEALRETAAVVNSTLNFDEVVDQILTSVGRVVPHDAANIMLIENGVARLARGIGYDRYGLAEWLSQLRFVVDEVPLWQDMMRTGKPFAVADTRQNADWQALGLPEEKWIRSTIKAPISSEGAIIGILHLDSATPGSFTQQQADRLAIFANQAAIALRNAQQYAVIQRYADELDTLREVTLTLTGQLDEGTLTQALIESAVRLLQANSGAIMYYRPELDALECVRKTDNTSMDLGTMIPRGAGVSGRVLDSGEMLIINNYRQWAGRFSHPRAGEYPISSKIGVPIRWGAEFTGVMVVDVLVDQPKNSFNEQDARLLSMLASQAAVAIQNARLYDTVQRHASELEQRVHERTAELEQERVQLQVILDTMGEALVHLAGAQPMFVNQAFADLFGYELNEVSGSAKAIYEKLIPSLDDRETILAQVRRSLPRGRGWQGEVQLQRKDGSLFDAAIVINPIPVPLDDNGHLQTVALFRDISQEKALRAQKDRFIANASHELRTPLANIKTRLYLIRNQPDRYFRHLEVIEQVTTGMSELIENLLDVSRFERGVIPLNRRPLVLQDVIQDVTAVQQAEAAQRHITLVLRLLAGMVEVYADPQRIAQVLTNLISNAINYTPDPGRITVELDQEPPSEDHPAGRAVIRVIDTGIGIQPELLPQVFEPFFRVEEVTSTGTGLGLTIVREIVHLHGGEISVNSEVGEGSVFTVKLDVFDPDTDIPKQQPIIL